MVTLLCCTEWAFALQNKDGRRAWVLSTALVSGIVLQKTLLQNKQVKGDPMKTPAMVIDSATRAVSYGIVEVPDAPAPGHVLVDTSWLGICRSDTELLDGDFDSWVDISYPIVPGHEWSGVIAAVGDGVSGFAVGDRVVGECVTAHMSWFGLTYDGAGSERFTVLARLLHKVPDSIGDKAAAMVEPFTVAYRALQEAGNVDAGDAVAVIGGGMIGQCVALAARAMGAVVVVIEPSDRRRELALQLGADAAIDPTGEEDVATVVRTAADGEVRVVIEASGNGRGIASSYEIAGNNGTIVQIGVTSESRISAPLAQIQAKNLTIRGITGSSGVWPRALRFLERAGIDLSPLASSEFTFAQAAEAFDSSRDPAVTLKVLLRP